MKFLTILHDVFNVVGWVCGDGGREDFYLEENTLFLHYSYMLVFWVHDQYLRLFLKDLNYTLIEVLHFKISFPHK